MNKNELIELLDEFKSGLISQATNGQIDDDEYKKKRNIILNITSLQNNIPLFIKSNKNAGEFRRYMQGKFEHYRDRRNFITLEMNKLIDIVEDFGANSSAVMKYTKTNWEKIDESVELLMKDLNNITDRISINEIGVRCRETLIFLANEVYDDKIHHPKDFTNNVSTADAKRMLDGYFEYNFYGSSNDEKRAYSKACNKLADFLIHAKSLDVLDAKLCINATISLIQIIKTIHLEKQKKK